MAQSGRVVARAASVLVVAAMVLTACGSSSKSSSPSTTASSGSPSTGSATTGSGAGNTASAPGITPTTIKIGFITSFTGAASSTFATASTGAKAYFNAVNKAGGVDGRQIQLVTADDTSTASGALAATQLLLSQGVYGIVVDSSYYFGVLQGHHPGGRSDHRFGLRRPGVGRAAQHQHVQHDRWGRPPTF